MWMVRSDTHPVRTSRSHEKHQRLELWLVEPTTKKSLASLRREYLERSASRRTRSMMMTTRLDWRTNLTESSPRRMQETASQFPRIPSTVPNRVSRLLKLPLAEAKAYQDWGQSTAPTPRPIAVPTRRRPASRAMRRICG
jgi:hypothetical protein